MDKQVEQKAAEATVANAKTPDEAPRRRRRIPFSNATRRLEMPAIDGFYCHYFLERNILKALDAGYEFVKKIEVDLNSRQVGGEMEGFKGTDLGDRVSLVGDLNSADGKGPERCYLMKIRQEWRNEDTKALEEVARRPIQAIFADEMIIGKDGRVNEKGEMMYVKQALFNRPARKAKIGRQS